MIPRSPAPKARNVIAWGIAPGKESSSPSAESAQWQRAQFTGCYRRTLFYFAPSALPDFVDAYLGRCPRLLHSAPLALRNMALRNNGRALVLVRMNYSSCCFPSSCSPCFRSGRMCGNKITSRMDCLLVSSIVNRSMPIPMPAAGGMP
jgi:hypothetical protein